MGSKKVVGAGLSVALVIGGGWVLVGRDSSDEILTATFADASPLEAGNEVRVDGVRVGSVESITLDGKVAKVALKIQKSALPLHRDTKLTIRPINVLGENYVAVDPGTDSAPFLTARAIPIAQTSSAVQLQDVLDTFNSPTSTALAALVTTLGEGTRDGGTNVAAAIKALAPTMNDLNGLGEILRQQNDVLDQLVERADPVARSVAGRNGKELDQLVGQVRSTLQALGDNQRAIEDTVAQLPATLAEARRTLNNLSSVSNSVTPTLERARPLTSKLSTISDEIVNFSKYADPAFNGFGPLFEQADRLLKEAAPVARTLRTAGPHLKRTAAQTRPVGRILLDEHLKDLMSFVTKWALSTNSRDGASHYFRGVVYVTPKDLLTLAGGPLPSGTLGGKSPTAGGKGLGALGGTIGGLAGNLTGLLGGVLGGSKTPKSGTSSGGATGLSSSQEQNLLTQLLGGR